MKRGEVWTAAGGSDYAGKPRPVAIIQDGRFETSHSITVCSFTSDMIPAEHLRLLIEPDETNGLELRSHVMIDKITSIPRTKLGRCVGRLSTEDMKRISRAIVVFLALS